MSIEERIDCFNGEECSYIACPQFNTQLDTCNFKIIGLLKTTGEPTAKTSPVPQQKRMSGETKPKENQSTDDGSFANLQPNSFAKKLKGKLIEDPTQRDVDTSYGPATVTSFRISDGSANLKVSLWGDVADESMDFTNGMEITLTNMSVKDVYDGVLQVSSTRPNPKKKFEGTKVLP